MAEALNLFLPSGLNWNERKIEIVSKFNLSGVNYPTFQGQVGLVWAQNKTKKPYLIEMDSVKWTGKVPVRTAITDTCEGQVSAALLQWQVLRFLRYKVMKWNFSKLLNSNSNCKMNKHAKLRQTNQFTSNFSMIPRCQRSSRKIRQKGPKADWGQKVWWNLTGKNYTEFL